MFLTLTCCKLQTQVTNDGSEIAQVAAATNINEGNQNTTQRQVPSAQVVFALNNVLCYTTQY